MNKWEPLLTTANQIIDGRVLNHAKGLAQNGGKKETRKDT